MDGGNGNGSTPIYNKFLDLSMSLCQQGTLIHPARFLFNAGKTSKEWNAKMLSNPHYKVVDYWADSTDVFSSVDIKGGVAVTYWNKKKNFGAIGLFSDYEELREISKKVGKQSHESFSDLVAPRELYRLTETLYNEYPLWDGRQSKGHKFSLGANIFGIFPEIFFDECPSDSTDMALIYGRANNTRCFKWCKKSYITHPNNFNSFKVIIPKSNGSGAIGEVMSTPIVGEPIVGEPIVGYTDTFIGIGTFDTRDEAEACLKYVKTKFARTMLGILKVTQDNPKDTWRLVPLQDFTEKSDIDWGKSIADIDQQLYAKYNLSEGEIKFIEEKVKPMV